MCVCSDWEQQEQEEEEEVALESWGCQIPQGARLHQAGGSRECLSASFFVLKCFLKRSGCGEMEGKCAL